MSSSPSSAEELIGRIAAWAEGRDDIRCAIILGSRARTDTPADEWSDVDLLLIATDPRRLLDQADWIGEIGQFWLTFLEPTATGANVERRVLFAGALDVDFVPIAVAKAEQIIAHGWSAESADVVRRGARFVVDKDDYAGRMPRPPAAAPLPRLPGEAEFVEAVSDTLYHAVWTAKKLRRGELWTAKLCLDSYMKRKLLAMIEWQARAAAGADTWHNGRFLERWASPEALEGLRHAYAYYDEADVRRALWATLELYRALAHDVADALGLRYPAQADEQVTGWLAKHLPREGGRISSSASTF